MNVMGANSFDINEGAATNLLLPSRSLCLRVLPQLCLACSLRQLPPLHEHCMLHPHAPEVAGDLQGREAC